MTNEEAAAIVRKTVQEMRIKPGQTMLALEIAARAIERGRHLTEQEKIANFHSALREDTGNEDAQWIADFIEGKC